MIAQTRYLNLIPDTGPLNVHCSQYDAGIRTLVFGLYKGASLFQIPEGMTAKIRGAKPDGNVFEYSMTVDAEANTVSITITEQMSVIAGDVICEVVLFNGATDSAANVIGSANFTLIVEPSPIDMGEFSDSDIPAIETLINGGEIGQIMTWKETGAAWTWAGQGDMKKSVYDTNDDGVVDNAEKVNGKTVARDVAADEYTNAQIDTELGKKVDKETGKGLSTNDYTTGEKNKLGALPTKSELDTTFNGKVDKVTGKQLSTEDYTTTDKTKLAELPTKTDLDSSLNGKVDKETGKGLSTNDFTDEAKGKLDDLPAKAELDTALDGKVDKVSGKGLSTEDYTTAEKTKLGALPDAATLNADLASKQSLLQVTQSISGGYLYNNYYSVS